MALRQLVDTRAPYAGQPAEEKVRRMDERREPFGKLPTAVMGTKGLSMGARVCYAALRRYARDEDTCFPETATLAADLGVSTRQVRSYVTELVAYGHVAIEHRGQGKSNMYTLSDAGELPRSSPDAWKYPSTLDRKNTSREKPIRAAVARKNSSALGRKDTSTPIKGRLEAKTRETTPNGVGADAPPAAQNHTPAPPSEKPATTSAPYVIAEALLKAQNRVATPALCRQHLKGVREHVTDAYREHPQKPGTADALACIAYLLTDPWIADDVGRLTPRLLGSRLGPWLQNGKPAKWVDSESRRGKASPAQASPPSGIDPRLIALDPRLERWAAARQEERDRYREAHKHELGTP